MNERRAVKTTGGGPRKKYGTESKATSFFLLSFVANIILM